MDRKYACYCGLTCENCAVKVEKGGLLLTKRMYHKPGIFSSAQQTLMPKGG